MGTVTAEQPIVTIDQRDADSGIPMVTTLNSDLKCGCELGIRNFKTLERAFDFQNHPSPTKKSNPRPNDLKNFNVKFVKALFLLLWNIMPKSVAH